MSIVVLGVRAPDEAQSTLEIGEIRNLDSAGYDNNISAKSWVNNLSVVSPADGPLEFYASRLDALGMTTLQGCFIAMMSGMLFVLLVVLCCRTFLVDDHCVEIERDHARIPEDSAREETTLEARLKQLKRKKAQLILDQVMNKQRIEKTVASIEDLVREQKLGAEADLSKSEDEGSRVEQLVSSTEMLLNEDLTKAFATVLPYAIQTQVVVKMINERITNARQKALSAVEDELRGLGNDMTSSMKLGEYLLTDMQRLATVEMPTVALLMASAFAPAQLRLLLATNAFHLYVKGSHLLSSAICIGVGSFEYNNCGSPRSSTIWYWFLVDMIISSICSMIRIDVRTKLEEILSGIKRPPPVQVAENPVDAFRKLMDYYWGTGCDALLRLDGIVRSTLYIAASWAAVFDFLLLLFAVEIVLNTPFGGCESKIQLVVLRVRALIFLCLIGLYLAPVISIVFDIVLGSNNFRSRAVREASQIDEALGLGVPVAAMLVRAFLVRDSRDMVAMELRVQLNELEFLKAEIEQKDAELARAREMQTIREDEVKRLQELRASGTPDPVTFGKHAQTVRGEALRASLEVFKEMNKSALVATEEVRAAISEWDRTKGQALRQELNEVVHQGLQQASEQPGRLLGSDHTSSQLEAVVSEPPSASHAPKKRTSGS